MPIASTTANLPKQNLPKAIDEIIYDDCYKHSVVDSSAKSKAALLANIEGSNYRMVYYSQVLGKDEELDAHNPTQPIPYQQYHKINDFLVRLQGSIATSFDSTTHTATATGSAYIFPSIKPNANDMFVGDIGDGQAGIFKVTEVTPLTLQRDTVYSIEFALVRYATAAQIKLLDDKVVKESYFKADLGLYGANPLISPTKKAMHDKLSAISVRFLDYWLNRFYSNEYTSILYPFNEPTYDIHLMNALSRVVNVNDHPIIQKIYWFNCDDTNLLKHKSIWDNIIMSESFGFDAIPTEFSIWDDNQFNNSVIFSTVRFSGVENIISVVPSTKRHIDDIAKNSYTLTDLNKSVRWTASADVFKDPYGVPSNGLDKHYMFSADFYKGNTKDMSDFERLVYTHITSNTIDTTNLIHYMENLPKASPSEFYYYGLVCYILSIICLRGCC